MLKPHMSAGRHCLSNGFLHLTYMLDTLPCSFVLFSGKTVDLILSEWFFHLISDILIQNSNLVLVIFDQLYFSSVPIIFPKGEETTALLLSSIKLIQKRFSLLQHRNELPAILKSWEICFAYLCNSSILSRPVVNVLFLLRGLGVRLCMPCSVFTQHFLYCVRLTCDMWHKQVAQDRSKWNVTGTSDMWIIKCEMWQVKGGIWTDKRGIHPASIVSTCHSWHVTWTSER